MPPASADHRKLVRTQNPGTPTPEQEHLLCPRCDSINTKFCYYNNYNFSQPRYFCKSCRRYWTHGGTLRDIPFGGGSRRNAKRSRTISSTPTFPVSAASHFDRPYSLPENTVPASVTGNHGSSIHFSGGGNVKENDMRGSFTSLLNTQGPGFLALGRFGLGLGTAFDDIGFGLPRGGLNFAGIGDGVDATGTNANALRVGNTWQLESGDWC